VIRNGSIRSGVQIGMTRLVGINHVALEVGDVEEALAFYGQIFEFSLRGRSPGAAFIDIGDQFIALMQGRTGPPDRARHFGLVVEDKEAVRKALEEAGVQIRPGRRLDFQDPWGNTVEVVQYDQVQFTKTERVLRGMGLRLGKTPQALAELEAKDLA
jgi:lactoylglutathione lyase